MSHSGGDGARPARALPPPKLISDRSALEAAVDLWLRCGSIAVDTEADAFFAYREKICLLQISTEEHDWIVDPLADIDLRRLEPVLASPSIRKVFHDAEFDVALLKSAGLSGLRSIFDTRLGVALLGSKTPGLSNVLRERYGIALDKSQQRSDWRRRPLTGEQLEYARHDTRHLLRLAADVEREIVERGLQEIFDFECVRLEATEPKERLFDSEECLGYRGARELDGLELATLRELTVERDRLARERDEAPFRIVSNDLLVLLARLRPSNRTAVESVRALPPRTMGLFGPGIVAAVQRAARLGPWRPQPRKPTLTEEEMDLYDRLRRWRSRKAEQLGFDSSAVLNRRTLEAMVKEKPQTLEELARVAGIAPWQLARFGAELVALVRGQ